MLHFIPSCRATTMAMNHRLLRPRASGGGFDPRSISGLELWLDAADQSTLFDADTGGSIVTADAGVGRWIDKSGKGRNFTQSTANNRPLWRAFGHNGRGALDFDGSNDELVSSETITISQPNTTFVVASHDNDTSQGNIVDGSVSRQVIAKMPSSTDAFMFAGGSLVAPNVFVVGQPRIVAASFNTSSSNMRVDGQQVVSGSIPGGSLSGSIRVGQTDGWNGKIAELLFYSGALPITQIVAVEKYLSAKWGIALL